MESHEIQIFSMTDVAIASKLPYFWGFIWLEKLASKQPKNRPTFCNSKNKVEKNR